MYVLVAPGDKKHLTKVASVQWYWRLKELPKRHRAKLDDDFDERELFLNTDKMVSDEVELSSITGKCVVRLSMLS